jgi:O-antigen/teichoic acid export membrane protein
MSGEQNMCAAVYAGTLAINIALNFILIPKYGLAGAATATTIALIFEAVALYAAALYRLGVHMFIIPIRNNVNSD